MKKEDIIEDMRLSNPWWDNGKIGLPEDVISRDVENELYQELFEKKVTGIIGLRRTGKTTLAKMLIKKLLNEVEPKRICYFSFDLTKDIDLRKLIKIYSEEILKEPYGAYESKVYFFFDEIQKLEDWGDHLKSIQDKKLDMKFVITGSSSMNITKGAGESLVGRIKIHHLRPFSFREYLRIKGEEVPEVDLEELHYLAKASDYRIKFKDYLKMGGFPELYEDDSIEYLNQILDLIFFRDIVDMFTVKRTEVLKGIFRSISERTGQRINYSNLANELNTQFRTVKDYIQYLEDSFLVEKSVPHAEDYIKSLRKNPKMYVSDHSFAKLWHTEKGLKAETVAFNHLKRREEPKYVRKPEVDIILPREKKAFEVKYSAKVGKSDAKNLLKMPEEYQLFLVTDDEYDTWEIENREVTVLPLWLLALTKG